MSSQLAVVPGAAVVVSAEWLNQLDLVKRTVAPGLTDEEFALFCHIARVRHLDPLQRQIHAVKRKTWNAQANGGKGAYEDKMTIQTAIDGYRSIANRTGLYMPSDKGALLEGSGDVSMRITMWVKKYHPISASWHEFSATAYYREFVQTRKDENKKVIPNSMWEKMPVNQLTKCAEALALRKGWPEELGGIYVDEEMQHADSPTVLPPTQTQSQQDRTKKEMGTMKTSAEPNRGHGNEGTMRTEAAICAECRQQNGQHTDDCKLNPKNRSKGKAGKDTGAPKKNPREQWDTAEGHDREKHISFSDFVQLCDTQKDLKLSDEELAKFLDGQFDLRSRRFILQADFQKILDAIKTVYAPPQTQPEPSGEEFGLEP